MAPPTIAPAFIEALRSLGWDGQFCHIEVDPQGRLGLCVPARTITTIDLICDVLVLILTILTTLVVTYLARKGAIIKLLISTVPGIACFVTSLN
jgi:hypothetical protein